MKRSISLVLCLAMLVSVFSCFGVTAAAAEVSAKKLFTVKEGKFKNDKITYTIYLKKGVKMSGSIVYAKFDSSVLAIDKANTGAYMTTDRYGDKTENINGYYEQGFMAETDDKYSIAHIYGADPDYNSGSSNKPYMKFTFKAIDGNRPKTNVKFYCYEFKSNSTPSKNITNGSNNLIHSDTRSTLSQVVISSAESEKNGVSIKWGKVKGADLYNVYKNEKMIYQTTDSTVTEYLDKNVKNKTSYTYTVRAVNEASYEDKNGKKYPAPLSDAVSVKYTATPSGVTLTNDNGKVVVKWSKVSGATAYKVYRRTVDSKGKVGSWVKFNKVTTTTYTDKTVKSGTTYQYVVRAYSDGGQSDISTNKEILYLSAPVFSIEATVKGVKITWDKVSGAENYRIYRKLHGGSWKRIKNVSSTSYTDTEAPSGKRVYYTIKALNGSYESDYTSKYLTYLKTPSVSVENTTSGVKASWDKVKGASKYEVYRKAGSAKSWTKVATTKNTSYTDKNVKSGTTYKYTIRAVNSKVKSKYGSTAYETIRFLSAPKLGKITSTQSGVTIHWTEVKGASKYLVYRKTDSGDYELIKTVSGGSTVEYIDESAEIGKTYSYKVCAGYSSYVSSYDSTLEITDEY